MAKSEYTIVTDKMEQKPLIFPKTLEVLTSATPKRSRLVTLHTSTERLNAWHPECQDADYYIRGYPHGCVIEKKGSLWEVTTNIFKKTRRARFLAELRYLQSHCAHPVLLFLGSPGTLLRPRRGCPKPGLALDFLIDLLWGYDIELLCLPNDGVVARRAVGEWAARLLLRAAIGDL